MHTKAAGQVSRVVQSAYRRESKLRQLCSRSESLEESSRCCPTQAASAQPHRARPRCHLSLAPELRKQQLELVAPLLLPHHVQLIHNDAGQQAQRLILQHAVDAAGGGGRGAPSVSRGEGRANVRQQGGHTRDIGRALCTAAAECTGSCQGLNSSNAIRNRASGRKAAQGCAWHGPHTRATCCLTWCLLFRWCRQ